MSWLRNRDMVLTEWEKVAFYLLREEDGTGSVEWELRMRDNDSDSVGRGRRWCCKRYAVPVVTQPPRRCIPATACSAVSSEQCMAVRTVPATLPRRLARR